MIQDYLKTSLVFYDDINKQHRYNDCCQEKTNWDKLKSPTDRFLPFQIRIPTDDWVGDINSVTLYDNGNNVVANLITAYGIRPLLDLVSNCSWSDTYVWIIYNGGTLSAALPVGEYYIKITDDASNAWYSELFLVCDMTAVEFVDDDEIILRWINEYPAPWAPFDTFSSDDNYIVSAINTGGGTQGAHSNAIDGTNGERFYYEIDFTRVVGAAQWNMYLMNTDNLFVPVSNQIALAASGIYTGTLTTTAPGPYYLVVYVGLANQTASIDVSLKRIINGTYNGMIGLEWYNKCDFNGIIYQDKDTWYSFFQGFKNRLYFERKLESPRTETVRDEVERVGVRFTKSIVQKKFYMFSILVPEFLYNVLQTLQLYANERRSAVYIYLDNGDVGRIKELNVLEEWIDGNCYCKITIEFREDAVVWTNCCDNYALRDESSCS